MNRFIKRTTIGLTALCLSMFVWTDVCFANTQELPEGGQMITMELEAITLDSETPLDNDELFEEYVESRFGVGGSQKFAAKRRAPLTGVTLAIYEKIKPEIAKVANGSRTSTVFEVSLDDLKLEKNGWTAAELGVDSIVENGAISNAAVDALLEMLDLDLSSLMSTLLAECPYELYWYDKTTGVSLEGCRIGASYNGKEYILKLTSGYKLSFAVAQGYSAGQYQVSTTNIERVNHAVDKAAAIVAANNSNADFEKLTAYKEAICDLVSYDNSAAGGGVPYGDPWQLVSVFDEDSSTNVVCEGYSKAFQYLCDLTNFAGDISCISVSGTMYGGTGEGPHMWNIVNMEDGNNYLVDVTNCDNGTIGNPDLLFFKAPASGDVANGYTFDCHGQSIGYSYKDSTLNDYSEDELKLAGKYIPGHIHHFVAESEQEPTCTDEGWTQYICDECGNSFTETLKPLGHYYEEVAGTAVEATCTTEGKEADQKCIRCDAEIKGAVIPVKEHAWDTEYTVDEQPSCTVEGYKSIRCKDCRTVKEDSVTEIPALGHDYKDVPGTAVEATCTTEGKEADKKCTRCTAEIAGEAIPALGHDYEEVPGTAVEATCTTEGKEADQKCTRCDAEIAGAVIPMKEHDWDTEYTIDEQPSCTVEGYKSIRCKDCRTVKEGSVTEIPALGHDYKDVPGTAVEATCTKEGKAADQKCTRCDAEIKGAVIHVKEHDWDTEYTIDEQPSCTVEGYKSIRCKDCKTVKEGSVTEIPALGHDYKDVPGTAVEATCTAEGRSADQKCTRCDAEIKGAVIHVKEHDWDTEYTIDEQPSCTVEGYKSIRCKDCKTVKEGSVTEIPALGHDYKDVPGTAVEATCTAEGRSADQKCTRCDSEVKGTVIPAIGHKAVIIPAVAATYTKTGLTQGKKCSVCGEILVAQKKTAMLERTSITKAAVSNIVAKAYTGKALTQVPTVKLGTKTLKSGTDYKLTYTKNVYVGTATVKITGVGAYKDTITRTYKICPQAPKMISVIALKKGFTAKWYKKTIQTTGYQLQYSTSSTFASGNKYVTIAKNTIVSTKVTKLLAKKKYYVRLRTYKTVNGVKYYSAWSAKKYVTTKK